MASINPTEYLLHVLPRLTRRIRWMDLPALLPTAWKARHVDSAPPAAASFALDS
jgi:hypothetical protein